MSGERLTLITDCPSSKVARGGSGKHFANALRPPKAFPFKYLIFAVSLEVLPSKVLVRCFLC